MTLTRVFPSAIAGQGYRYKGGIVFSLHEENLSVSCFSRTVKLTRKEFQIFLALHASIGRVCSREELLAKVWGNNVFVESRTIDRHVVQLRRKLKKIRSTRAKFENSVGNWL